MLKSKMRARSYLTMSVGYFNRTRLQLIRPKGQNIDFLTKEEWPPYSPDLNPLDYSVWGNLENRACSKPHKNLESLQATLKEEWLKIPQEELRNAVLRFRDRVRRVVKEKGGYIE